MKLKHDYLHWLFWYKKNWKSSIIPNFLTLVSLLVCIGLYNAFDSVKNPNISGLQSEIELYQLYYQKSNHIEAMSESEILTLSENVTESNLIFPVLPVSSSVYLPEYSKEVLSEAVVNKPFSSGKVDLIDGIFDEDTYNNNGIVVSQNIALLIASRPELAIGKGIHVRIGEKKLRFIVSGVATNLEGFTGKNFEAWMSPTAYSRFFNIANEQKRGLIQKIYERNGFSLLMSGSSNEEILSTLNSFNFSSSGSDSVRSSKYITKNIPYIEYITNNIFNLFIISMVTCLIIFISLVRTVWGIIGKDLEQQKAKIIMGSSFNDLVMVALFRTASLHIPSLIISIVMLITVSMTGFDFQVGSVSAEVDFFLTIFMFLSAHLILQIMYVIVYTCISSFYVNINPLSKGNVSQLKRIVPKIFIFQSVISILALFVAVFILYNSISGAIKAPEFNKEIVISSVDIKRDESLMSVVREPFYPISQTFNQSKANSPTIAWANRLVFGDSDESEQVFLDSNLSSAVLVDEWKVTPKFIDMLGITITAGMNFTPQNEDITLVNEEFMKRNPSLKVGSYLFLETFSMTFDDDKNYKIDSTEALPIKIVGVVKNIELSSSKNNSKPMIIRPLESASDARYLLAYNDVIDSMRSVMPDKVSVNKEVRLSELVSRDLSFIHLVVVVCLMSLLTLVIINYISMQVNIYESVGLNIDTYKVKTILGATSSDITLQVLHEFNIFYGISLLISIPVIFALPVLGFSTLKESIIYFTGSVIISYFILIVSSLKPLNFINKEVSI